MSTLLKFRDILKLKKWLLLFLWFIIILILTRQVPFGGLNSLSNIALFILVLVSINWTEKSIKLITLILLWVGILFAYGLIMQNQLPYVFRFTLIFTFVLLSYFIHLPKKCLCILFLFVFIQCLVLIGLEFYLLLFESLDSYMPIRFFFLERGWGDVYSYSGYFYSIQLRGSAIVPFAYMLTYVYSFKSERNKWILRIIFFSGTLFAGNFAFYISLFIFHFFRYVKQNILVSSINRKNVIKLVFLLTLLMFLSPLIYDYIQVVLERKSEVSLGTRSDQFTVLINDMQDNILTLLAGKGLGNTLSIITSFRDYRDNIYFELQSIYFLNQLGILNFLLFIFVNAYLSLKTIKRLELLWLYFCYVIYAVTNPYILDTTHVVVIISLISLNNNHKFLLDKWK